MSLLFVTVARKPLSEPTVAQNVLKWGTGGLNIDGCRVAGPAWAWGTQTDIRGGGYGTRRPAQGDVYAKNVQSHPTGRWPANLILVHLPGCQRAGTKQVKGSVLAHVCSSDNAAGIYSPAKSKMKHGHTDADGMETVDAWECVEGCPAKDLDGQSGVLHSRGNRTSTIGGGGLFGHPPTISNVPPEYDKSGGASRFFKQVTNS